MMIPNETMVQVCAEWQSKYDALAARLAAEERMVRQAARLLRDYEADAHPDDVQDVIRWLAVYDSREARATADSASVPPIPPSPPPARDVTGRTGPPKPPNTGSNWIPRGYHMRGKP